MSALGSIVPLGVAIGTVPVYLGLIGKERYGVLAFVTVLLSYFSVFDLGLDRATSNQIARLRKEEVERRTPVFWTALIVNIFVGAIGGAVLLAVGHFLLSDLLRAPTELRAEAISALPWLALAVPLTTATSVAVGALEGLERFGTISVVTAVTAAALQLFPLVYAMAFDHNLAHLVAASVLALCFGFLISITAAIRLLEISLRPRVDRADAQTLVRYGGWITVSGLVAPLLTVMDRVVIGTVAGPIRVTEYTIPFTLVSRSLIIPGSLGRALFPRLSALSHMEASVVQRSSLRVLVLLMTPFTILGLVIARPFLDLWLGSDVARSTAPVAEILLIGMWINSLAVVPYVYLQARGKPGITARFHVAEVAPYAATLWVALSLAGIRGAAWAWTGRAAADALLLFWAARRVAEDEEARPRNLQLYACFGLVIGTYAVIAVAARSATTTSIGGALFVVSASWTLSQIAALRQEAARSDPSNTQTGS